MFLTWLFLSEFHCNKLIHNHTHQEICGGRDGDAVMIQPVSIVSVRIAF
jgi:hypothetical protein